MSQRIALFLPTLEGGGAERAFIELANRFAACGFDVDFVVVNCHGPLISEVSSAVRIVDLGADGWLKALIRLVRYLRQQRPDVLMSGLDPTNVIAVLGSAMAGASTRCVISQRSVIRPVWQLEHPRTWRWWYTVFRLTYRRARMVICNSSAAADEVVTALGVNPTRCRIILNAVDVDRVVALSRVHVDDPWLTESAPPLVISVGRLMTAKDVPTLIRALAIVRRSRPCNLLILGDGVERPRLEALRDQLHLQDCVRMPGFTTNPFAWMSRADVLVSTSLAEGCPNVIQQGLALGVPIIATDCPGGTAEVLEHGKWGRLVPMSDPVTLAQAILEVLDRPSLPDGTIRARDFDLQHITNRYLDLLLPGRCPAGERNPLVLQHQAP